MFYGSFTGDVMSVTVAVGADGAPIFGVPRKLFSAPGGAGSSTSISPYDVAPDGERFLVALPTGTLSGLPPISVTLNWQELLKTDTAP